MAALQYSGSSSRRPAPAPIKTEEDMDSFFDFNQGTNQSPVATSSVSNNHKNVDTMSPYQQEETQSQHFNGPSHDYSQFKQQVGLPMGSLANMPQMSNGMYDGFGEVDFNNANFGWNTGLDLDGDMGMEFPVSNAVPAMFFPPPVETPSNNFVDPSSLSGNEEPTSNVGRLWPGMHSQQAQQLAMAKAVQQRQMKPHPSMQAQHRSSMSVTSAAPRAESSQQAPIQSTHANTKRASYATEPHVEESISRLLSQMRQSSNAASDDVESNADDSMPSMGRLRKDEEDMDEDERLLASEEGKKLSSKERRQLRNKVSARAFRSRRKEYIGQLEGEVALKVQENNALRSENKALLVENERYRGLIETLLRHPAYTPFIKDLSEEVSKDAALMGVPAPQMPTGPVQHNALTPVSQTSQPQTQQPPQQDITPDYMNFDASQLQIPQQPSQQQMRDNEPSQHIGMAMVPETDFRKLDINGFGRSTNINNFSVNAYALTTLPPGPNPVDLLADMSDYLPAPIARSADLNVLLAKLDGAARRVSQFS